MSAMFSTTLKKSVVGLATIAAVAAVVPSAASASTASRTGTNGHVLTLTAAAGEANDIEVYSEPGYVLVWERNNTDPMWGEPAGCVNYNAAQVQCPRSLISSVYVDTGDRNDRIVATIDAPLGVTLSGGAGNDYVDVKGTVGTIAPNANTPNLLGGDGADQVYGWQFSDSLSGGYGDDILGAGRGNDRLDGGPGADRMDGGEDSDTLYARDGYRDFVACGTGSDAARTDKRKFEALLTGCESAF
jgi:Ca2+-binding RTX toxin-like protein